MVICLLLSTMTTADEALARNGVEPEEVERVCQMNSLEERTMGKMTRHQIPLLQRQAMMPRLETYRIECGAIFRLLACPGAMKR